MRLGLKLNAIEQEHLQELYDAAGVPRDQLPYTEAFDRLCQDFQDRAFKNAEPEQVYTALMKYVRSSTCKTVDPEPIPLDAQQMTTLKTVIRKHGHSGKLTPYSSEFDAAHKEFNSSISKDLSSRDFWLATTQLTRGRKPPTRRAKPVSEEEDAGDDE